MPDVLALAAGFGTGLSLIVAIGSQNAFVLRQGIRRDAVLLVVLVCIVSDAVLIVLGVGGVGAAIGAWPWVFTAVAVAGGLFLLCYGALAARRAFRPSAMQLTGEVAGSRRRALGTALALTWLNPHVYLDTVLLLGSVAAGHGSLRWYFALGATLASVCWFVALGFGARLLSGFFTRPSSWRVLDGLVATTMLILGTGLLASA
ncbi:LysE/ArgO family amino acid transporter [Pseudonocardia spinosispora]|uniref:LysE/ArgO family amino acid transporter n=1 Tax=Pseudonocardia spinosispora TaxID=103441 RepID=UPI000412A664|nr:LysE family transporter [Pseudonocardia spinosispora]